MSADGRLQMGSGARHANVCDLTDAVHAVMHVSHVAHKEALCESM